MKEPMAKREKTVSFNPLKRIVLQVTKEWYEKPVLFYWMMTYQLVGTLMCMFYSLLSAENKWLSRMAGFTGHADW